MVECQWKDDVAPWGQEPIGGDDGLDLRATLQSAGDGEEGMGVMAQLVGAGVAQHQHSHVHQALGSGTPSVGGGDIVSHILYM